MTPVYQRVFTPRRFLDVYRKNVEDIVSVKILPPKLGSKQFGLLVVEFKEPTYKLNLSFNRSLRKLYGKRKRQSVSSKRR